MEKPKKTLKEKTIDIAVEQWFAIVLETIKYQKSNQINRKKNEKIFDK